MRAVRAFFFRTEDPQPLAWMRICLGLILCYEAAIHWPYAIELYSRAGGPMPLFPASSWCPPAPPVEIAVLLATLWVFSAACVAAGWYTKLNLWLTFGLLMYLGLLDAAGTFKKYSVVSLHLLFLLSFTSCGKMWSLDACFRSSQSSPRTSLYSPLWPKRLMQLMLCAVYWGAAVTKLKLPGYGSGELLMFSLLDPRWSGSWVGFWLSTQHHLLILATWITVFFELLFPVLVWLPRLRIPLLACGFLFHLSLAVTMSLNIFTPVMWVALCAFLNADDFHAFANRVGKLARWKRLDRPALSDSISHTRWKTNFRMALFPISLTLFVGGGYWIQYQADWYGVYHTETRLRFHTLGAEEAAGYLESPGWTVADYLHRVEFGSRAGQSHLFGSPTEFRQGQIVYVYLRWLSPHPEWELKVKLTDPEGDEFSFPEHIPENQPHHLIQLRMTTDHLPGNYHLELFAVTQDGFFPKEQRLVSHRFNLSSIE